MHVTLLTFVSSKVNGPWHQRFDGVRSTLNIGEFLCEAAQNDGRIPFTVERGV